jgi:hypothetical protein
MANKLSKAIITVVCQCRLLYHGCYAKQSASFATRSALVRIIRFGQNHNTNVMHPVCAGHLKTMLQRRALVRRSCPSLKWPEQSVGKCRTVFLCYRPFHICCWQLANTFGKCQGRQLHVYTCVAAHFTFAKNQSMDSVNI